MLDTHHLLSPTDFPAIRRKKVDILQVNLGYTCNLSCTHCHVNAGPKRTEQASLATVDAILTLAYEQGVSVLDVTGGAPEMNPHFRYLIREASARNIQVINRSNLTIMNEPGFEDLAQFLAEYRVNVTASLPCYQEKNVNEQRGKGVFDSSIEALKKLNSLGYARDQKLTLNLVYNPNGAFLPPEQKKLEATYKKQLFDAHGIIFNELLTITNMPISRFGSMLMSKGIYADYIGLLRSNYAAENLAGVMCLNLLSIDWQGYIYDCDFNQMLGWPLQDPRGLISTDKERVHVSQLQSSNFSDNPIAVGEHCYGCTAGQGSSCGGALA